MDSRLQETWRKLAAFDVDDPGDGSPPPEFTFAMRLADENGWPLAYAGRVVDEYKRFVFLATFAGHPVTPSDQVDQAWHLHLTYTRSYWTRMCDQVLERRLHHDPTRGGAAESIKFDTWYARTLESYTRMFGSPPPADIWPAPLVRFDPTRRWRRVDVSRFWLLRRRTWIRRGAGLGLATGTLVAAGGWYAPMLGASVIAPFAIVTGLILLLMLVVVLVFGASKCGSRADRDKADGGGGCSSYFGCSDRDAPGSDSGTDSGCSSGCGGGCGGGGD